MAVTLAPSRTPPGGNRLATWSGIACIPCAGIAASPLASIRNRNRGRRLEARSCGSSINAPAITYTHKGQQYVTVQSGLGGSVVTRFVADKVSRGGAVWTFALMP